MDTCFVMTSCVSFHRLFLLGGTLGHPGKRWQVVTGKKQVCCLLQSGGYSALGRISACCGSDLYVGYASPCLPAFLFISVSSAKFGSVTFPAEPCHDRSQNE